MTTPTQPRLSELVAGATKDIQTLVRGEIQLAKAEVTGSVKNAGAGVGLGLGAFAVLLFAVLIFAMSASFGISEGFDWPVWSGFAIVGLILVLLAVLLVFLARRQVKKVRAPEQTLAEVQKTKDVLADRQGKGVTAGLIDPDH
jgi:hypothetical protein